MESIDPVRFISNRSTGYMGYKIAEVASKRHHVVTLISGPTNLNPPKVKKFIPIETASDLLKALKKEIKYADCLIMVAAVGDFRPIKVSTEKIKRQKNLLLKLAPNKDILKEISRYKKDKLFIGFSLETESLIKNSYKKIKDKDLDLIVANQFTKLHNIFGNSKLEVKIIDRSGHITTIYNKDKPYIAQVLLDKIEKLWYLKRRLC